MAELNDATDVVADVAEEVAESATEVAEVARSLSGRDMKFLLGGIGLGLVCGGVSGYFFAEKRLRTRYEEFAEEEIDEMREHFRKRLVAKEEKPNLSEAAKEYEEEVAPYGGGPNLGGPHATQKPTAEGPGAHPVVAAVPAQEKPDREDPEAPHPETVVQNVFVEAGAAGPEPEWDYEEEVRLRRPEFPYVINVDERNERDYIDATFVYYEGDDVLANEQDEVVDNRDKIVGEANLEKFGHGSGSPDAVYVRNEVLGIDVEILKNDGNYAEIVHGFVRHADEWTSGRARRRPRFDDD